MSNYDSSGNLLVNIAQTSGSGASSTSTSAALTSVAAASTSTQLLAANPNRKGASITNNGTANLYIAYGLTASTSLFTAKLPPGALWEMPTTPVWEGAISGIWDVTNGSAVIQEVS